jgi:hypothetical protein
MRLLLAVVVHSAGMQGPDGVKLVGQRVKGRLPRLELIWTNTAYGSADGQAKRFTNGVLGLGRKPGGQKGFVAQKGRQVVERIIAWLTNSRGLAWDYERLTEAIEGMVQVAAIHLMPSHLEPA